MIRKRSQTSHDVVAVFDLDGTLTGRDTSLPFVAHAIGAPRLALTLAIRAPLFGMDFWSAARREAFRSGGAVRARWESNMHRRVLAGAFPRATRESFARQGLTFATEVLDDFVVPEAMAQLRWHVDEGHRCVLASASLDCYVGPWASRMGFDRVVGTRLAYDDEGRFLGHFHGEPCWGLEKLHRVQESIGSPLADLTVVAYGNSSGDSALLAAADLPFLIRGPSTWADVSAEVRKAV